MKIICALKIETAKVEKAVFFALNRAIVNAQERRQLGHSNKD